MQRVRFFSVLCERSRRLALHRHAFSTLAPSATAEFVVENEKVVGFGWNIIGDDGDAQSGSGRHS